MPREISKDWSLCISLAARPSHTGTRFHNFLYDALDLPFLYKAFAPTDIAAAVQGIRGLPIRGAAVSMPYKAAVIPLIDSLDDSAAKIGAVNTIVNTDGHLRGYNTDVIAVEELLRELAVAPTASVMLLGSGGMASACAEAIARAGFTDVTVIARSEDAGNALAAKYGWQLSATATAHDVILNATPVGMAHGADAESLPVREEFVAAAEVVFDVVAMPAETPLVQVARRLGKRVVTGDRVMALQAVEQFELYTGIRPDADLVAAATAHSRAV